MYYNKRMNIVNFLVLVLVCNVKYDLVRAYRRGEEVRCVEKEREALLRFKKGLVDDFNILSSWGSEAKECCKWQGVRCSNTTGHVMALLLPGDYMSDVYLAGEVSSALLDLHHLKDLDLSENDFGGSKIPNFLCSMTQLQHLDLSTSNFSGILPPQLGNITNLKTLVLSDNDLSGVIPPQLGNLTNLETLDLAYNNNMWSENLNWLESNLTLLSLLGLSYSKITDADWAQHILKLHSLHELQLQTCGLVDVKPSSVGLSLNSSSSTSSLSILNLSENDLTSFTIDLFLNTRTRNLRTLYIWGNKLKTLPSSIWQLSRLEELDVSYNSLEGTITEAKLNKFHNLKRIDLSFNRLTLDIKPDWNPPFQLELIGFAGCNMGPRFPLWLRKQNRIHWLDISYNGISGEVPKWFWSLSTRLQYLNISHNEFTGAIPDYSPSINMIDVSFNKFSGHIPSLHPSISIFQLSQNMFSGSISSLCELCPIPRGRFWLLDLSYNKLVGELPNCWQNMTGLYVVNLSNNNFSGEIPPTLGYLSRISTLYLGNNNLSGKLPSTLKNCEHLYLIDIGNNMVTGGIPTWIGTYHESLTYLIFHNNRFEGGIPRQICSLSKIQVLDLSGNNLSGNIPPCFDNFNSLVEKDTGKFISLRYFFTDVMHAQEYIYYAIVSWKRQESQYRRTLTLLKLVDLSSNRLVGDIPGSFSSLKELISLNLSKNSLIGNISRDIGQMEKLECLDLSNNQLSGTIPTSLAQLTFLAVLDLSNNSLSGKIPSSTQLQSIAASGYAGNIGLCGSPLPLCPGESPLPSANNEAGDADDEKDNDGILGLSFVTEIVISVILGYIFGFWGVVGSLIVKESWRRAYFKFWDAVGNWLYVTVNLFWAKFKRS